MSPPNLVPNLPGIRRACGTCVRAGVSVLQMDLVAVVLHSVCVCMCTEGCCAALCPLPTLPCLGMASGDGS